jgi:hypothetical protein
MSLIFHVLPGDATVSDFENTGLGGGVVVCREALVDGNVRATSLEEFWKIRSEFIENEHDSDTDSYYRRVASEFEKLLDLAAGTEVNLWFEYELFCQVNMWFCINLLRGADAKIFRVAPVTRAKDEIWKGFGRMPVEELRECFAKRIEFVSKDRELGEKLWQAYLNGDHEKLDELGDAKSECFPYLREVCTAAMEKSFKPEQILEEIKASGVEDFGEIFAKFSDRAGVYGFGDSQVQGLLSRVSDGPAKK